MPPSEVPAGKAAPEHDASPGPAPEPTPPSRSDGTAPKRTTKRRVRTRQQLLGAASDVFAEQGFGRSTVEQVCDRAGFSRGAFYSNFASLDELFLAMWEQRSERMLAEIREAVGSDRTDGGGPPRPQCLADSTDRVLGAIPVDEKWYRIDAEFTAHALRNPSLKRVLAAREESILATIMPIVEDELRRIGRRLTTDPASLGRALVAVHDGTSTQCLVEPGSESAWEVRRALFVRVLESYSEPAGGSGGEKSRRETAVSPVAEADVSGEE